MKQAILAAILATSIPLPAFALGCQLNAIPIDPISSERTDIFIGKSKSLELRFRNERTEGVVEVFPEPPLTIENIKTHIQCAIDGGVWVRKSVYLSNDESTLVTHEYSGSNDSLNFYSTRTCRKTAKIDVSNSTWTISGSEIVVSTRRAAKSNAKKYVLTAACMPIKKRSK